MPKKQLLSTVAAAALALGISCANAADLEQPVGPVWYVSLFGGVSWLDDVDQDYVFDDLPQDTELESKTGFIVGGAVGTHLTDDLRIEIEAAYSENELKKIHFVDDGAKFDINGKFGVLTFMGNLWYDIPLGTGLRPYLGGGAGVAIVNGDYDYAGQNTGSAFDSSEAAFAFQLGAGLRWAASDNITLDVGYRFRGIDGPTFDGGDFSGSDKYHSDWMYSSSAIAGVSLGF